MERNTRMARGRAAAFPESRSCGGGVGGWFSEEHWREG